MLAPKPIGAATDRFAGSCANRPRADGNGCTSRVARMRVSGASAAFVHDSLSIVNVPRRCCRPGCPHYAVATLTFVYSDSTAVVGPLATAREPHSWDLCVAHAGRITAPRGWELVRHAGPLPTHPDEDDLVALANAVREGGPRDRGLPHGAVGAPLNGFPDPHVQHAAAHATAPSSGLLAPPEHRSGRRRGHLRVLPDPGD
jgi:Protein of unknown function (DUF3499)